LTAVSVLRVDPLTGDVVRVVSDRQQRPNLPQGHCPFCPGGLEAPEPYRVRAFPNRWPSLPVCEVVLYSPDHDATLATLDAGQARSVVDLWAERSAALGARDDVDYVLVFENRGPEVGATISHPHGQIYAFDLVPPTPRRELDEGDPAAALGPDAPADRLVRSIGSWRTWVPEAATSPYALVLAPDAPCPDLPSLDDAGRDALGALLIDAVGRLDRLFDAPMPYMMWIHQRPFDGGDWPQAWLHVHLSPLLRAPGTIRFVAAGELGGGVMVNPVDPADAARALREA
jgi:UDPglucose--hexose-1-phosphate uridylyltransferase